VVVAAQHGRNQLEEAGHPLPGAPARGRPLPAGGDLHRDADVQTCW